MRATDLERAIFDWIAARNSSLAADLAGASIVKRENTGAGSYTFLGLLREGVWSEAIPDELRFENHWEGPTITSPELELGGGSLLWLSGGRPACLEIYVNGTEGDPEKVRTFELGDLDGGV